MGRLRIKPKDKEFKQGQELKKLVRQIENPQQLALLLHQVGRISMRQAMLDRIRPWLKFKIPSAYEEALKQDAQVKS